MKNIKLTYEELEQEVIKLRKMQETNIHTNDKANFHYASMNAIDNAIYTAPDINEMMSNVLKTILDLFDSERAWLLFPCDPDAKSWTVPMECTKPGFEGAHALGEDIPMFPGDAEAFKRMQSSHEVVTCDYTQNPKEISIRFSILSEIYMPLHPKTGKAWLLGMHQCTYARLWTNEEKKLFKEIGNRISDTLNSYLFLNKLKESEERFKELVTTINSGVAIYEVINNGKSGSDYLIQDFNEFALKHEQLEKKDIIGKSLKDIRPNIDEYGLIDIFQKVWKTGQPEFFPAKVYVDEKFSNYYENNIFRLQSGEIVAIYNDVSDRENAIAQIRDNQERFDLAMKASNDGLFDWNLETNEIYYSPGWKKMIGYEDHEIPNDFSVWEKTTDPEDVKKSWELQQKLISKEVDRFVLEFKMKHKKGHWIDILSRAESIFNDKGKAIRIVGTHTDITERKHDEQVLLQNQYYLTKAQEMGSIGTWELDIIANNLVWTDEAYNIFGIPIGTKVTYELFLAIVHPDDRNLVDERWTAAMNKEPYDIEHRLLINGKTRWVRQRAEVKYDNNGKAINAIGITQDITIRKQAETELIKAKDRAQESDRLKSTFLANMSHEIRTPMNGILGFTSLLKEPKLSGKEQEKYISIIESSGQRLLSTVNDLIDISKIEAGQMKVSVSEVDINDLIENISTFFGAEANKKGLQLLLSRSFQINDLILTDQEKLYSILSNLIKNAIKYTQAGSIEIGYQKNEKELKFFVKDTGDGIIEERLEDIFARFIRNELIENDATEGSGLGLSISKAYVEMLGGTIWAKSKVGVGSQFYFTIPFKEAKSKKSESKEIDSETKSKPQIKDLKILIAEDEETGFHLLSVLLKDVNKELLHAKTGLEAVELCRNNPDIYLVLMDIQMPGMDGYEATKQIRAINKEVIIIAQTAYAMPGDNKKSIEAGCNDYITKPINKVELLEKIKNRLSKN